MANDHGGCCRSRDIVRYHSRSMMKKFWAVIAAGVALMAFGAVCDLRFVYVGLIVVLIVLPMTVQFAIMKCLASKWAVINLRARKAVFTPEGIRLLTWTQTEKGCAGETGDVTEADDPPCEPVELVFVPWTDILEVSRFGAYRVLRVGKAAADSIFLPEENLDDTATARLDSLGATSDYLA